MYLYFYLIMSLYLIMSDILNIQLKQNNGTYYKGFLS